MDKDIVLQAVSEFVVYYEHVTTQAFKTKYIQLQTFAYTRLLNKPYENEVTLIGQNLP